MLAILRPYNLDRRSVHPSRMIHRMISAGYVRGGQSTVYRDLNITREGGAVRNLDFVSRSKPPLLNSSDVAQRY